MRLGFELTGQSHHAIAVPPSIPWSLFPGSSMGLWLDWQNTRLGLLQDWG